VETEVLLWPRLLLLLRVLLLSSPATPTSL
jgi:hypothetical protein